MLSYDAQLTGIIIRAAMTVLDNPKPGLDEKLHERALIVALTKQGMACDQENSIPSFMTGNSSAR